MRRPFCLTMQIRQHVVREIGLRRIADRDLAFEARVEQCVERIDLQIGQHAGVPQHAEIDVIHINEDVLAGIAVDEVGRTPRRHIGHLGQDQELIQRLQHSRRCRVERHVGAAAPPHIPTELAVLLLGGDACIALAWPLGGGLHRDAEFRTEGVEDGLDRIVGLLIQHQGLTLGARDQGIPRIVGPGRCGGDGGEEGEKEQTAEQGHERISGWPIPTLRPKWRASKAAETVSTMMMMPITAAGSNSPLSR